MKTIPHTARWGRLITLIDLIYTDETISSEIAVTNAETLAANL